MRIERTLPRAIALPGAPSELRTNRVLRNTYALLSATLSFGAALKTPHRPQPARLLRPALRHDEGVAIDDRPPCRAVWLDRGEPDKLVERSVTPARPRQGSVARTAHQVTDEYAIAHAHQAKKVAP